MQPLPQRPPCSNAGGLAGAEAVLLVLTLGVGFARVIARAAAGEIPADIVLTVAGYSALENLEIVLPVSLLLAILLAVGRLCRDNEMAAADKSAAEAAIAKAASERERLKAEGSGGVLVNWQEILRERTTYGYTGFVTPQLFARLREAGVLGEDEFERQHLVPLESLSERDRDEIAGWGTGLRATMQRGARRLEGYVAFQLFTVH